MNNNGLKRGRRSQADAEKYLKYLDGTAYTHIPGLILGFNDRNGPNPFRIVESNNGDLNLWDAPAYKSYNVLCQYDYCPPGEVHNLSPKRHIEAGLFCTLYHLSRT